MTAEAVRAVLAKLRVKPGLKGDIRRKLDGKWAISFEYDRALNTYTLTLSYEHRAQTIALDEAAHVETRGHHMWRTEATWRLSTAAMDKFAPQIATAIETARARGLAS